MNFVVLQRSTEGLVGGKLYWKKMSFQKIIVRCAVYMLSISAKNKSQAVMWRVLNYPCACPSVFVSYCVKNLHLKCTWSLFQFIYWKFRKRLPLVTGFIRGDFVLLVLLVNLVLPVKLKRRAVFSLCVWGHSGENRQCSGEQQHANPTVSFSLCFPGFSYLFIFISSARFPPSDKWRDLCTPYCECAPWRQIFRSQIEVSDQDVAWIAGTGSPF